MTRPKSVLLAKYAFGYHEVAGGGVRREGKWDMDGIYDTAVLDSLGGQLLAVLGAPLLTYVTSTIATSGSNPYDGYDKGDYTGSGRIQSMTITEDLEGVPTFVAEFQDPLAVQEQRVNRAIRRMADGNMAGKTDLANPATIQQVRRVPARTYKLETWSWDSTLVIGENSPNVTPPFPMMLTLVLLNVTTMGTGAIGMSLNVDGVAISGGVIEEGETRGFINADGGEEGNAGDGGYYVDSTNDVSMTIINDGGGAEGVTAVVLAAGT